MSTTQTREVAHRLFATELEVSNFQFKQSDDEMAPNYLLLASGETANRVLLIGTLTEKTDMGNDTWRGRIVDPTGNAFVYATEYQPEAAAALRDIEPPEYVAVVGKPSTFQNEDGETLVNIRPEQITVVTEEDRNTWIAETADATLTRLAEYEDSEFNTPDGNTSVPTHYGEEVQDEILSATVEALEELEQTE